MTNVFFIKLNDANLKTIAITFYKCTYKLRNRQFIIIININLND